MLSHTGHGYIRGAEPVPDVSILVLTYNHEPYIADCLDGILSQDYAGSVEVLVGEDRSTDATPSIVASYVSKFPSTIRVVTAKVNVGMHANNRRLIRAARGRYIAYCEGDDLWHRPDKLSRQIEVLDRRPDIVGVHSNIDRIIYHDGFPRTIQHGAWQSKKRHIPTLLAYEDLIARNCVQTCSTVFRTTALKTYPDSALARELYPMDDWPMFLHALKTGPILHMPEPLATYRHTPSSVTRSHPEAMVRFLRGERRLIDDISGARCDLVRERREGLARVRRTLVRLGVQTGDWGIVQEALEWGRRHKIAEGRDVRLVSWAMSHPATRSLSTLGLRGLTWMYVRTLGTR